MKRLAITFPLAVMAIFLCFASGNAQAQQPEATPRSYIYCTVEFDAIKEVQEEKINSYTKVTKEWKVTMKVDYGQYEDRYVAPLVDNDGNVRIFNSEIAALNWMGLHGWELITPYYGMSNGNSMNHKIYLRRNVTGMTSEEINEVLSIFSNKTYNLGDTDSTWSQNPDGLFQATTH